jgi:hypothetical protein
MLTALYQVFEHFLPFETYCVSEEIKARRFNFKILNLHSGTEFMPEIKARRFKIFNTQSGTEFMPKDWKTLEPGSRLTMALEAWSINGEDVCPKQGCHGILETLGLDSGGKTW